ncbi:MAG TPA: MBG domain-containing protein [Pirellulales bacterium]|nr:MBG domain-containing protein [Pirellulales bacterium]
MKRHHFAPRDVYIGTDETGTAALANAEYGVTIGYGATNNRIGADGADAAAAAEGNLISGNGYGGVEIWGAGANGNWIAGNLIGTDKTGDVALPNAEYLAPNRGLAVVVSGGAADNVIGSDLDGVGDPAEANLISGNYGAGIVISGTGTTGNLVAKNLIGLAANGFDALGNTGDGVEIYGDASGNLIGGLTASGGNEIAFNMHAGIDVISGSNNRLTGNLIYGNGRLGIDLGGDGVTPNHAGDSTSGPNDWQNYPTIQTAAYDGSTLSLAGTFNSTPNTSFLLDFYASPQADPSGYGQGQQFLTRISVTTDASGNAAFSTALTTSLSYGDVVTAVATDPNGNTSEFSQVATLNNHAPSFTASNPPAVNEDSGAQAVSGWAAFDPGPGSNEADQTATYSVSNVSNASLFSVSPSIAADGTLTYTLAPHQSGTSTFDVQVQDSGGTANGGIDTSATQTFTITVDAPAAITSANADSFVVNSPGSFQFSASGFPPPTVSVSGPLPTGVTFDSATGTLTGTPALGAVATFPLTVTAHNGVGADATQSFTLTVTRAAPAIAWSNPADITYGTALGVTQLDATANVAGAFSYTLVDGTTAADGAVLNAGQHQVLNVTFTPTDTTDYSTATALVQINIAPATLTVTADDKSKLYGEANPMLTASYIGFVNGDDASALSGVPSLSTTAVTSSPAGKYPITVAAGTLSAANYMFAFQNGTLTVTQAAPVITWSDPADITYGTLLGATQLDATANTPGSFSYMLADDTTPASGAVLNAEQNQTLNVTFTPTDSTDYTMATAQVDINVDPAALTVTGSGTQVYGGSPSFAVDYSGFVLSQNSSVLGGTLAFVTTTSSSSDVGTYPNAVTPGGLTSNNYAISFAPGDMVVMPATLTVKANNASKVYGTANPTFTDTITGFVNGDGDGVVSGVASLSTTATTTSAVGSYPIAAALGTLIAPNYTFAFQNATLLVTQATPVITWSNPANITYGTALGATQLDAAANVAGSFSYMLADDKTTANGAVLHAAESQLLNVLFTPTDTTDYATATAQVQINVTPAPLTITADDQNKVYGAALPALTASYAGFVNGDSAASLTTQPSLSTAATAISHVSGNPYVITASGAVDADYTISYVAGSLTVTPATLTVKANDASRVFSSPNPIFTDAFSGFVSGDDASVVSGAASLTTTATTNSPAGSYPITAALGTLNAANYTFAFQNGTLTVTTNLQGAFGLVRDVYVIGSGTVNVSADSGVLVNDSGPGQIKVAAATVIGANGGTFVFHADGSFTYTPPADFPGFDYSQYTATDSQGDKASATVNVLSQTGGVVWKFYESVLGRDPDYGGLQFWINDFNNGGKTGDIAAGFFESDELLNKIIGGYYQQYLGRTLDPAGLAYWKGVWHATGGPEGIKAGFAASPEFNNNAGNTPDGWLTALYQRILNRTPDPQGFQYWQQQLANGASEVDVALGFFDSTEAYQNDVTVWFNEYLGRVPSNVELTQYANEMANGKTDRDIEQEITNLPEYGQNPPAVAAGTAARLADYHQRAAIAAKDNLFSKLGA